MRSEGFFFGRTRLRIQLATLLAVLLPMIGAAAPMLSIDLDLGTPGIQSNAEIDVDEWLAIAAVFTSDGTPASAFSSVAFDIAFDSNLIGLAPGGGPTAGDLAGTSLLVLDTFGGGPTFPAGPLTQQNPMAVDSIGGIGLLSLAGIFATPPGETSVALMTFRARAPGTAVLSIEQIASEDSILALFGDSVSASFAGASIGVRQAQAVPEPSPRWLMFVGVSLLAVWRRVSTR